MYSLLHKQHHSIIVGGRGTAMVVKEEQNLEAVY